MPEAVVLSADFKIVVPEEVRAEQGWESGQEFVFIPRGAGAGVLLIPVPKREELMGIAKGANPEGYRDRDDRY